LLANNIKDPAAFAAEAALVKAYCGDNVVDAARIAAMYMVLTGLCGTIPLKESTVMPSLVRD
jgi:hypothetical protein